MLVSNFGHPVVTSLNAAVGTYQYAKCFSTGQNTGGYNLTSLELDVKVVPASTANLTVAIYSSTTDASNNKVPDAEVVALAIPTLSVGTNTFAAPANTVLDPSTVGARKNYCVFIADSTSTGTTLELGRADNALADTLQMGWSLENGYRRTTGAWAYSATPHRLRVRLNGSAVSGTPTPTNFTAAVGNAQVTLSWDTPPTGVTGHEFRYKTGAGSYPASFTSIANSGVGGTNATSFTVGSLTNEVAHTFELRAVNNAGNSTAAEAGPVTPTPGICGRTDKVQEAIVYYLENSHSLERTCAEVTVADLATLTYVEATDQGITSLKAGDFAGADEFGTLRIGREQLHHAPRRGVLRPDEFV